MTESSDCWHLLTTHKTQGKGCYINFHCCMDNLKKQAAERRYLKSRAQNKYKQHTQPDAPELIWSEPLSVSRNPIHLFAPIWQPSGSIEASVYFLCSGCVRQQVSEEPAWPCSLSTLHISTGCYKCKGTFGNLQVHVWRCQWISSLWTDRMKSR